MSEMKENNLQKAIDGIEPSEGAKERMLANIRRKAAQQSKQEEAVQKPPVLWLVSAKKWVLPLAACLAIAAFGATVMPQLLKSHNEHEVVSAVEMGNPFVEVKDAQDFESRLGIKTDAPDGAEDVVYHIIDGQIADIDFLSGEHRYNLRASRQKDDFSGLYGEEAGTKQLDSGKNALLTVLQCEPEVFLKITWTEGDLHFVLSNTDGASEKELVEIFERVK